VTASIVRITGLLVGFLSGLMGIGGGAVASPLLINVIGVRLKQAAATSLAIVALASLSGTVTYALSGLRVSGMPAGSVGYVHVAAALPILLGSMISVRWGTLVNSRLHTNTLRRVFAGFLRSRRTSSLGIFRRFCSGIRCLSLREMRVPSRLH
jgi:uncharacterized membrane protein YfcA